MEVTREVVLEAPLDEVWDAADRPGAGWRSGSREDGEERRGSSSRRSRRAGASPTRGTRATSRSSSRRSSGGTRVVVTETGEPGWNAVFALRALTYAYA